MATGSLLTLLDDIATVLDDVTVMTKIAAKKTAGVLGDDLALNAQQVSGVRAERELPVVWAVFKGSVINKLILVPAALVISAVAPWLVVYLLMLGGLYLCFEGVEKLWHSLVHKKEMSEKKEKLRQALLNPDINFKELEHEKIKGAIRTDFVLSAEIIVIALGTVSDAEFAKQVMVVSLIATVMTIGVYGLVALIVKLDDIAISMMNKVGDSNWAKLKRAAGSALLSFCPWLMKGLSIVGTAAMFLVGGGILVHGIPHLHHLVEHLHLPLPGLMKVLLNLVVGILAGGVLVLALKLTNKFRAKLQAH
ncbi:hypothetical protein SAMN02745866_03092 [Alteromonadaceae bacterium Bs31]|nr:hypothetical protein SAMN02745866_03092 [Alteromonadaceae bacterium Bs31]